MIIHPCNRHFPAGLDEYSGQLQLHPDFNQANSIVPQTYGAADGPALASSQPFDHRII